MNKLIVRASIVIGAILVSSAALAAKIEMPLPKGVKILNVGSGEELKTLEAAFERVKEIRKTDAKTPLALCVAPGEYCPADQILITKEIASTNMAKLIVYSKDFSKKPRIHGGESIKNWKKVKFCGRNDVWCADVSHMEFKNKPKLLFYNGLRVQPARWPNLDPKQPYTTGYAQQKEDKTPGVKWYEDEVVMRPNDVRKWAHPEDGWAFTIPEHNYWNRYGECVAISNNILYVKARHTPLGGYNRTDRYYVENIAEELDAPGEWYFNPREKKLYIITPDGSDPNKTVVAFPRPKTMFLLRDSGNITFAGLELTSGHEGMRILSSPFTEVIACSIHDIGGNGNGGCHDSNGIFIMAEQVTVRDCDIYNIGNHGVMVHSYGPPKIDYRSNVLIENNYIHHCGEVDPSGNAVRNAGTGVIVRHNLMHDFPRSAISGYGRFSETSYNRIRHMNKTGDDTGALYDAAWTSCVGSKINYNWISDSMGYKRDNTTGVYRHLDGACGIYFDECSGGAEVIGNLVENCHMAGMHFHNARWITVSNNVFASNAMYPNCEWSMQFSLQPWNRQSFSGGRRNMYHSEWKNFVKHDERWKTLPAIAQDPGVDELTYSKNLGSVMMGMKIVNNIFYFPETADQVFMNAPGVDPTTNIINGNVYWPGEGKEPIFRHYNCHKKGEKWYAHDSWKEWKDSGFDKDTILANPMFEDVEKRDFRLKKDSPAFKMGFKELPYEKIGLQKTYFRPEMPVEAEGLREHPEWILRVEKVVVPGL